MSDVPISGRTSLMNGRRPACYDISEVIVIQLVIRHTYDVDERSLLHHESWYAAMLIVLQAMKALSESKFLDHMAISVFLR